MSAGDLVAWLVVMAITAAIVLMLSSPLLVPP